MTEEALAQAIANLAEIAARLERTVGHLDMEIQARAAALSAERIEASDAHAADLSVRLVCAERRLAEVHNGAQTPPGASAVPRPTLDAYDGPSVAYSGPRGYSSPWFSRLLDTLTALEAEALRKAHASPAVFAAYREVWDGEIRPWLAAKLDRIDG